VKGSWHVSRVSSRPSRRAAAAPSQSPLRDNGGEARIFVFGALGVTRDRFTIGARLIATGIVGQRESASGAGDGYRLWPRGADDLVTAAAAPTPRPGGAATPHPSATARPGSSAGPASTVRIGSAREGATVTVQGTVTTPGGLIDGEGRRVTIQDSSGAILLRVPDGASPPAVGTRIRVSGEVGTWYGGLQLAAGAGTLGSSAGHRRARWCCGERPALATSGASCVSRCVSAMSPGRATPGERRRRWVLAAACPSWVSLAAISPSTSLAEGRSATITGIVKRAYPTAADQRFAIVPRSTADIQLGADPTAVGGGRGAPGATDSPASDTPGDMSDSDGTGALSVGNDAVVDSTLDALTGLAGRHVRVSGALRRVDRSLLTIDDGSASAFIQLLDGDATFQPPLQPGEVLNVTGVVAARDLGGWEVVARSEALVRASALALPTVAPSPAAAALVASAPPSAAPVAGYTPDPASTAASSDMLRLGFALAVAAVMALMVMVGGVLATRPLRRPLAPAPRTEVSSESTVRAPLDAP